MNLFALRVLLPWKLKLDARAQAQAQARKEAD